MPDQQQQANVVHVNLYGEGCLFITPQAMHALAQLGQRLKGWLTRCDLAVDFWQGIYGGMEGLNASYVAGDMDVRGKRPKVSHHGDWIAKRACTFYLGTREAGKYTRVYCKGDQLFGLEANDPWVRVELQWGDQLRVLPWDMLQRPAEFFAGASDWHAEMLAEAGRCVVPAPVTCERAAALMTAEAEAFRNLSWLFRTAGASVAAAFRHITDDQFMALVDGVDKHYRMFHSSVAHVKPPTSGRSILLVVPILVALVAFFNHKVSARFDQAKPVQPASAASAPAVPARHDPLAFAQATDLVSGCMAVGDSCSCVGKGGRPVLVDVQACRVASRGFDGLVKWAPRDPVQTVQSGASPPPKRWHLPHLRRYRFEYDWGHGNT